MVIILGAILATRWLLFAVIVRLSDMIFLPLALTFFGASVVLFVAPVLSTGRLPHFSQRLVYAAITVSGLVYVMSPLLLGYALRVLPSGFAAMAFAASPILFMFLAYGRFREKANQYALIAVALGVFYVGIREDAELRGNSLLATAALFISVFTLILGVWISKRLFWLHSALDLNFWSMIFAGGVFLCLSLIQGEVPVKDRLTGSYFFYLGLLTLLPMGLGAYLYRIEMMGQLTVPILTATVPIVALLIGFNAWGETPINFFTVPATIVILYILVTESMMSVPSHWMTLSMNNNKRRGDRLICLLDAFMREIRGGKPTKIQVINLSIGGIGFRSEAPCQVGDEIIITLPLGHNWSSVTVDGKVAHCTPSRFKEFPWVGGIQFLNLSINRRQSLIEFLARLSWAEEDVDHFDDKLDEAIAKADYTSLHK
jgi:drug/metabolite transporter (DMT)-like permease